MIVTAKEKCIKGKMRLLSLTKKKTTVHFE
jgi:hypothetical protein